MQNLHNIDLKDLFLLFANDNDVAEVEAMTDKELENSINIAHIAVAIEDEDVAAIETDFTHDTLIARKREIEAKRDTPYTEDKPF